MTQPTTEVLPLEPGDRLTAAEFERRYDSMPGVKKAELIEGVVYMPSPVRHLRHSHPHFRLIGWLSIYEFATPGVQGGDNGTARLDVLNEPQPDALLLIDPACGGRARISADDYIEDAPELVAEVAGSSVSIDLNTKMDVYRRTGACEYLVWRVLDQAIDWFILREENYERLEPDAEGILRSETFPGLWLDPAALLAGDTQRLAEVSRLGLASPEHAAFVQRLRERRAAGQN